MQNRVYYVLPFVLKERSSHMDVCKCIESGSSGVNSGEDWEINKTKNYSVSYPFVHFEFVS